MFPRGLSLGQLNGTRDSAAMQPAIGVDSQRLTGKVAKVCGFVDALKQWE